MYVPVFFSEADVAAASFAGPYKPLYKKKTARKSTAPPRAGDRHAHGGRHRLPAGHARGSRGHRQRRRLFKDATIGFNKTGYATFHRGRTAYALHRAIMGLKVGDPGVVDHLTGNRLDNRRCGLRITTQAENAVRASFAAAAAAAPAPPPKRRRLQTDAIWDALEARALDEDEF
jgi:hypothetical protein